jgi:AcrR family transcriptional regulator
MKPQRQNGRLRVAAILKAATEVIAEKGYEATTMSEIAERSDTRVGSLYRFFPNKDSVASAMVDLYREKVDSAFDAIDEAAPSLSVPDLSDVLLAALLGLRKEGAALIRLLDSGSDWSAKREEIRTAALGRIAGTLRRYNPDLTPRLARNMALVLLQNMKTMKALSGSEDPKARAGAVRELRAMTRLYLKSRLKKGKVK